MDKHFYESINGGEPTCIDEEIPFDIPESWEWVRLESICEVNPRNKLHEELLAGFIPMASVREGVSNYHDVNTKKWGDIKSGYTHLRNNDVMVAKITPCFQNRKSAIVANLPNGYGAGSTEFHIARTFDEKIIPSFLLVLFKSEYFIQKGLATFTGTAGQQRISSDFFSSFLVALPPTNEQFRLVLAVQSRLQALNDIEKSRIRYKYILSETPTSLRQQLIQAAIQGQLVPQNPSDEPASILLERIAKERIAKLGKKAAKSISRIERRGSKTHATYHEIFSDGSEKDISDEIPFDLPENWVWCRLGCLVDIKSGSTYKEVEAGVLYVKVGDMNLPENKTEIRTSTHFAECPDNAIIPAYSIIFPKRGGAISTNKKRTVKNFKICIDLNTMALSFPAQLFDFARVWCENIELEKIANGSTIPQINNKDVEPLLFPLPPLVEQLRICNRLGKMLQTIEESRE